jgi:hypothetical protein
MGVGMGLLRSFSIMKEGLICRCIVKEGLIHIIHLIHISNIAYHTWHMLTWV